jgi:hypothetical protein
MLLRGFRVIGIVLAFANLSAGCGTLTSTLPHAPSTASVHASSRNALLTFDQADFRRYNDALDADIERESGVAIGPGGWLMLPFGQKAHLQEYLSAKYYRSLYQDDALCEQAQRLVTEWANTTSTTAYQAKHREAWEWIAAGQSPRSDLERVIQSIRATRLQRWTRLGKRFGMAPPQAFRLYRGINSTMMIDAAVQAWQDEATTTCALPLRTLSSWSLSEKAAVEFSAAYGGSNEKPWAVFEATVPFEQTLLDKWVDGSDFASQFPGQAEVVVSTRQENALSIDEKAITIYYQQKVYRYADRQAFIQKWTGLKVQASANR